MQGSGAAPPRANILRNPDNLGIALQLGKHLLAQTGGDLGVNADAFLHVPLEESRRFSLALRPPGELAVLHTE
jgi:hypothetical protein